MRRCLLLRAKLHQSATKPFQGDCDRQLQTHKLFKKLIHDDFARRAAGEPTWLEIAADKSMPEEHVRLLEQAKEDSKNMRRRAREYVDAVSAAPEIEGSVAFQAGLNAELCKTLLRQGIDDLTDAQHELLAAFLDRRDIILHGHTGCGKSFGLMMALAHRLLNDAVDQRYYAMVFVPSAALAAQMDRWLRLFYGDLPHLSVVVSSLTGSTKDHHAQLQKLRPLVVIATPDEFSKVRDYYRIKASLAWKNREPREQSVIGQFKKFSQIVIVDEAEGVLPPDTDHPMHDARLSLFSSIIRVGAGVVDSAGWNPAQQVVMCSATLTPHLHQHVQRFMRNELREKGSRGFEDIGKLLRQRKTSKNVAIISATGGEMAQGLNVSSLPHTLHNGFVCANSADEIVRVISNVLTSFRVVGGFKVPGLKTVPPTELHPDEITPQVARTLLFVEPGMEKLGQQLLSKGVGLKAEVFEGRENHIASLKRQLESGELEALVVPKATVRGLDFCEVSHVFILGAPVAASDFIHLAGRTARRGMRGMAVSLVATKQIGVLRSVCGKLVHGMRVVPAADIERFHEDDAPSKLESEDAAETVPPAHPTRTYPEQ
eukprot:Hpha_TRINITY_DN16058_c1_g1::TRINITY_DN16058_c1_g1_i2::g.120704::m.120704